MKRLSNALRESLPEREALAAHPWLRPVAHRVMARELWRRHHEAVARGAAVGMFWAFVVPFAQILFATAHCVWWRANIPVAAAITFITNPFTVGFWLWLAYQLGSLVIDAPPPVLPTDGAGVAGWLASLGWPTVLGMGIFAVGGAALAYMAVKIGWRVKVSQRRRSRRNRSA